MNVYENLRLKHCSHGRFFATRRKITEFTSTGFTLTEVIVATVIFMLTAAGLLAVISGMAKPAAISSREMVAVFLGKSTLEKLRQDVDADTFNTGRLAAGLSSAPVAETIENVTYRTQYQVTPDAATGGRNVSLTVSWDE